MTGGQFRSSFSCLEIDHIYIWCRSKCLYIISSKWNSFTCCKDTRHASSAVMTVMYHMVWSSDIILIWVWTYFNTVWIIEYHYCTIKTFSRYSIEYNMKGTGLRDTSILLILTDDNLKPIYEPVHRTIRAI